MKTFALIIGSILLAFVAGNTVSTALLSEPKLSVANVDETIYTDFDLHKLILNNLGLLSNQELAHSSEKIINKYGESILTQKILLNYLLLIDADSELLATQPLSGDKKAVALDACSSDDLDSCILGLLYDSEREDSVVTEFEATHSKAAHVSNHFYSSNPVVNDLFKEVSYSLNYDVNGNAIIVENRSGRRFSLKKNLTKCVNDVARSEARFDLENGVIFVKNSSSAVAENPIVLPSETKDILKAFAEEICTIVSMPKFITKDPIPALFTFYISSIRNLQKVLNPQVKAVIHKTLSLAYQQFKDVLKSKFGEKQVTGQVVLTNNTKSIEAQAQQKMIKKSSEGTLNQRRRMLDDTTTATTTTTTLASTEVIFRVFGVGFVLVLAVILASLAGIQVEKDTLVYSKFLTVDQRK